MTIHFTHRTGAAFTAAMVLGAALVLLPARAISADLGQLAQAAPPPTAAAARPAPAKPSSADRVEARIKSLRTQLKITAAQETQWNAVVQVMRDNAKVVSDLVVDREKRQGSLNAIDDLRTYEGIAEAHVAGVKKLIPAFQALYDTMSDAQKKNADTVFQRQPRRSSAKKSG
jgi:hypothetical protein